ncbi:Type II secretion system protein GspG [Sulfidibacter corallicola]|uniref:Type II secretion system protein GspG n=1 Tax=Sulfidibacter corallicola TaxID=2818388 RepID=A0A8A4TM69_SULCO|nr:type II secretion system protein GspG [Sulfidibacter corallicola]QTD50660.1 type II secretion system protein GspG [Sulfidibacter corallicola]
MNFYRKTWDSAEILNAITWVVCCGWIVISLFHSVRGPVFCCIDASDRIQIHAIRDIKTLTQSALLFWVDHGRFPHSLLDLAEDPGDVTDWTPYIEAETLTDPWGNPYVYYMTGEEDTAFEVWSLGADGRFGGEGEAADLALEK